MQESELQMHRAAEDRRKRITLRSNLDKRMRDSKNDNVNSDLLREHLANIQRVQSALHPLTDLCRKAGCGDLAKVQMLYFQAAPIHAGVTLSQTQTQTLPEPLTVTLTRAAQLCVHR